MVRDTKQDVHNVTTQNRLLIKSSNHTHPKTAHAKKRIQSLTQYISNILLHPMQASLRKLRMPDIVHSQLDVAMSFLFPHMAPHGIDLHNSPLTLDDRAVVPVAGGLAGDANHMVCSSAGKRSGRAVCVGDNGSLVDEVVCLVALCG